MLATRAFRRAIAAGDRDLARQAARALYSAGALPPDGEFLFLIDAIERGEWDAANAILDRVDAQALFSSLVPILRAWVALGEGDADPIALLDGDEALANSPYALEHRALLMLAAGRHADGVTALSSISGLSPARRTRLLLVAAATLDAAGERRAARQLLEGEQGRAFDAARERLQSRRSLPGEVATPAQGIAELFVRLAGDIGQRNADALALTLTRYAGFAAPENPVAWLLAAVLLQQDDQHGAALDALARVAPESPYYAEAQDLRVQGLVRQGANREALELVREHTEGRDADASDWMRYAALSTDLDRHAAAAEAYERALAIERAEDAAGQVGWTSWLLYGGALIDAGRWEEGRAALERALEIAPDEPVLLNYLGYALLERREQLDRAEELIRRASEMQPDSAAITDSLGWVMFVRGNVDDAIPVLERAVIGDPDEPTINEHLGDAYWAAGRRRDARFAWRAALVTAEDEAADRITAKLDIGLTPETASP